MDLEDLKDHGVDIDDGLNRFMGSREIYVKCLKQFKDDNNYADMLDAIDGKRFEDAFTCAHTLKGLSGNLSLSDLYQSVIPLVESLRHKEYENVDAQVPPVKAAYEEAVSAISQLS